MPLPSTMTPIATQTLTAATSYVTFNSIPQTYTDLVLVANAGTTASGGFTLSVRLNGDTGTNYSITRMSGNGSSTNSYRLANNGYLFGLNMTNTLTNNAVMNFMNYSNTTTYKTMLYRFNEGSTYGTSASVGLFRSTSAITSIELSAELGATTLLAGSTFTIYGIKAA